MDSGHRLTQHYERKYALDFGVQAIVPEAQPRDRCGACVMLASGGGTLLEVGAGSGSVALALGPLYERIVLTELAAPRAARLRGLGFEVLEGAIEDGLPLQPCSVDTIILNAVVEHLVEPQLVLRHLAALLRPAGELILTTPNVASWRRRIKLLAGRFPSTASRNEGLTTYDGAETDLYDEGHLHYFTFRSAERVLHRAGLTVVRRYGYPGRLARAWPSLGSNDVCVVARPSGPAGAARHAGV